MAEQKKKTILVTGGAGFIGSHLCVGLIADDRVAASFVVVKSAKKI